MPIGPGNDEISPPTLVLRGGVAALVAGLIVAGGCGAGQPSNSGDATRDSAPEQTPATETAQEGADVQVSIEEAQTELAEELMEDPAVTIVAIGECDGEPCIRVWVTERSDALDAKIPSEFKGYTVETNVSGEVLVSARIVDPGAGIGYQLTPTSRKYSCRSLRARRLMRSDQRSTGLRSSVRIGAPARSGMKRFCQAKVR